jgi:alkanesulfonate monooxygenase SsuD/methylene tetrahydromethanopterin reductase-like flavin-dependent oxidoreductase (luciferase family)
VFCVHRGISVPNVGDPRELVQLAIDIEEAGWDGFFVWDHVQIVAGMDFEVHDPWMVLAAAAHATERVALGTLVSAPARRRPWILAKQVVTLDHLSGGRAVLGVGLGYPGHDEFAVFGDPDDIRVRAERTDEALEIIDKVLQGDPVEHTGAHYQMDATLRPAAVQQPRPRIWVAATPPYRKPLERARRWDGVVCNVKIDGDLLPPRPDELRTYVGDLLDDPTLDVVTNRHPDHSAADYEGVGVSWLIDSSWPGDHWLGNLRTAIGLDA